MGPRRDKLSESLLAYFPLTSAAIHCITAYLPQILRPASRPINLYPATPITDGTSNRCSDHCAVSSRSWRHSPLRYCGHTRGGDCGRGHQSWDPVHWVQERTSRQLCSERVWLPDWETRGLPGGWRTWCPACNGWCTFNPSLLRIPLDLRARSCNLLPFRCTC